MARVLHMKELVNQVDGAFIEARVFTMNKIQNQSLVVSFVVRLCFRSQCSEPIDAIYALPQFSRRCIPDDKRLAAESLYRSYKSNDRIGAGFPIKGLQAPFFKPKE